MFLVVIASFGFAGSALADAQGSKKTEDTIIALEQQFMKAQQTNTFDDSFAKMLAENIVDTDEYGKITRGKTAELASIKAVKILSMAYEDLKVIAYESTAIATGVYKEKYADASGKQYDVRGRFTDTWVRMKNGEWQMVATQTSVIK
jgi:ketosteroid isomerase-like protein